MSKKLLLVTISGVQEFISQARKTIDFYSRSKIINDYLKEIYIKLKENQGTFNEFEVVVPSCIGDETSYIPNYFIATLESAIDNNELENNIREIISEKVNKVFSVVNLNVYIVVEEWISSYRDSYENLYKKLDGYKNNRFKEYIVFNNDKVELEDIPEAEKYKKIGLLKKCHICGKRAGDYQKNDEEDNEDINIIGSKEVICKKCLTIRSYYKNIKYYSTTDISSAGHDNVKDNGSEYYALIKVDIDNLGKHFSFKYLKKNDIEESFQIDLSKKIENFSMNIKNKLEELSKKIKLDVYLGGDDLLFFCPLNKVFEIVNFIDIECEKIKIDNYNKVITVSKSIVITYEKIPLQYVIKLSRKNLEIVKEKFKDSNKNGLSIALINSSLNVRNCFLKNNDNVIKNMEKIIDGFKNNISSSFISNLETSLLSIGENMEFEEYEIFREIMMNEIERIGNRKISQRDKSSKLIEKIKELFLEFIYSNSTKYKVDLTGYFNLLHILENYSKKLN